MDQIPFEGGWVVYSMCPVSSIPSCAGFCPSTVSLSSHKRPSVCLVEGGLRAGLGLVTGGFLYVLPFGEGMHCCGIVAL